MEEEATTTTNNTTTTSEVVPAAIQDGDGDGDGGHDGDRDCSNSNSSNGTRRLVRFACFAVIFWLIVLFLVYEHEERVLILVLVALCLVLMYLTVSICHMIKTDLKSSNGLISISNINDDEGDDDGRSGLLRLRTSGSAGLTRDIERGNDYTDDGCCSNDECDGTTFRFSFEDTAHQIRSLSLLSPTSSQRLHSHSQPQQPPPDGTYKAVYTAIAFGKPIRSEGFLQLKFKDGDDYARRRGSGSGSRGWDIEGVSLFGGRSSSRTVIHDGYLNSEGQMYWIVPMATLRRKPSPTARNGDDNDDADATADAVVVVYRGVFDFDQCCLTDGEFQSINDDDDDDNGDDPHHSGKINSKSKKTKGRIVRLEWVKEKSMTMDHHHHDDEPINIGTTGRGVGDRGRGVEMIMEMPELRQQRHQQQDDGSRTT